MNKKSIGIIGGIIILVLVITFGGVYLTRNVGKKPSQVTKEDSMQTMEKLLKKIDVSEIEARKASVEDQDLAESNLEEELPDIETHPLSVKGKGEVDIEIFSSPEKAGEGTDGWLNKIAKEFNSENFDVNGQSVSVSVRMIDSGEGLDYIASGKYTPEVFSPSNELWGAMLSEKGIKLEIKEKSLVGNVAGILLKKDSYDAIVKKYGAVNMSSVVKATSANELKMGYTNPLASSAGLNFIISTLYSFDPKDIFSQTAVSGFEDFQNNVPFVSQTTMQIRTAATSGRLDGLIIESQSLENLPELKNSFIFTPYGVRHDEPLYAVGDLTDEQESAIDLFVQYCLSEDSQKLATKYGFNTHNEYVSELPEFSGKDLLTAQSLWKEKKDSGKSISAVFVADISGSMDGMPLSNLQESLINGAKYISPNNSIGLVSYNDEVYINLPIAKFDLNQYAYFKGSVEDLTAGGGTASYDAIVVALDMLMKEKKENPDAKLMLFLLSDGDSNVGYSLDRIRPVLEGLKIPVYTIGYNANIKALQNISDINEAASINADSENVVYKLKGLFNATM